MTGYGNTPAANRHIAHIDAVNALARLHYRRTKDAGSSLDGAAAALRALPTLLRHLRQEASDPDSALNREGGKLGVARHLHPLIEETNFVLHELGEVLDLGDKVRKDGRANRDDVDELRRNTRRIEERLGKQKSRMQKFLDEIQLRDTPPPIPPKVAIDDHDLDNIKDKLDVIATKLFRRRGSNLSDADEDLWEQFCIELEREGFDRNTLRRNKEILRAYIRSLETSALEENGRRPPTVRGLLKKEETRPAQPPSPAESPTEAHFSSVAKASTFPFDHDQKPPPSPPVSNTDSSSAARHPRHHSIAPSFDNSADDNASSSSGSEPGSMALISTRDLLELDRQEQMEKSLVNPMNNLNLYPPPPQFANGGFPSYSFSPGSSPRPNLPASSSPLALPSSSSSDSFAVGSPQYYPVPPAGTSPALIASGSASDDQVTLPRLRAHLAPDSQGQEIPMDAKWTKIKRTLVSPQVLEEAGVRYEARPAFVAVLGTWSQEKIAEFARRTAEVRASRGRRAKRSRTQEDDQHRAENKERRERERGKERRERERGKKHREGKPSEDNNIWDEESDTSSSDYSKSSADDRDRKAGAGESRRRTYPSSKREDKEAGRREPNVFVVSPAAGEKTSPAAASAPKPILKNKNENRVHFGRDGPFEIPSGSNAESPRDDRRRRDDRDRRDRERDRERDRKDRDRDRDRDRERERDRRDRERERDRDYRYSHDYRDRDRDRDRDRERKQRHSDLIRAAGIGGAAASLLSVLAEAAVGL